MFDHILLEPEQQELLIALVEATRNVKREPFWFLGMWIEHPGLKGERLDAYMGDIESLRGEGLLRMNPTKTAISFDVTPRGFKYYEYLKARSGQPIQRVEITIHNFLNADAFQKKYPLAYQKWAEAEKLLWSTDTQHQLTTIGHLCREAIQEFTSALVEQYQPSGVTDDKAKTIARMKVVLAIQSEKLGTTVKPFLEALLSYWGTTSDLIQRQEHGGLKEGQPLAWEDGRRIVFNTAVVMFEIDRALP